MNWRIKGVIQGVLSRLPAGQLLNDYFQETMGGRRHLGSHVQAKFEKDWLVTRALLDELHVEVKNARLMEIGTGWLPVFPVCFAIEGAASCVTLDLSRHLKVGLLPEMLRELERYVEEIARAAGQPTGVVRARLARLADADSESAILGLAGVTYLAPADAGNSPLRDASIDIAFSNSVLEHVSPDDLQRLFREMHRVVRPGGIVLHGVNCGDHYAYFDRSISQLNYLKFPSSQWRKWNNDLQFQNRLRPADFVDAASRAGFRLVLRRSRPRLELLDALPEESVAQEFRHYSREELSTTSLDFAAVRD